MVDVSVIAIFRTGITATVFDALACASSTAGGTARVSYSAVNAGLTTARTLSMGYSASRADSAAFGTGRMGDAAITAIAASAKSAGRMCCNHTVYAILSARIADTVIYTRAIADCITSFALFMLYCTVNAGLSASGAGCMHSRSV